MIEEKLLTTVEMEWQALALQARFEEQNIKLVIDHKAREYASIITGSGGEGTYRLYLDQESDRPAAESLLNSFRSEASEVPPPVAAFSWRRFIMFTVFSFVLLPFVFNIAATVELKKLFLNPRDKPNAGSAESQHQKSISFPMKALAVVIWIVGWALALAAAVYLLSKLTYFN